MTRATTTRIDPRQLPLFDLWPPRDAEASLLGRLGIRNPIVVHAINRGQFDYLAMSMHEIDRPVATGPAPKCGQWVRHEETDEIKGPGWTIKKVTEYRCRQQMHFRYIPRHGRRDAAWCCFAHSGDDPDIRYHYRLIEVPRPRLQTAPDFDLFAEIKRAIDGASTDLHFESDGWHLRHEEIASVR